MADMGCECCYCRRRFGNPPYRGGRCSTCYNDITSSIDHAVSSNEYSEEQRAAIAWLYQSHCRCIGGEDCQRLLRTLPSDIRMFTDGHGRYLDARAFPETHRVSPWIRVRLTAVNETVFVRSDHEPGRVLHFRRARRIEEEEPIPAPGGYQ